MLEELLPGGGASGGSEQAMWCSSEQTLDKLFTEMPQHQDSQESQTSIVVEKQVDSEPCRVISQGCFSRGSAQDEGWKQVTPHTGREVPPPPPPENK